MSKSTISTFKLFETFPTNESARLYLEGRLWPNGPVCPECKTSDRITTRKNGFYRCNACKDFDFTIRTGTVFERSKVPLNKWVYAMYLVVTARKGISSMQLAKEIGVMQKTAWFMLGRLREACTAPDSTEQTEKASSRLTKRSSAARKATNTNRKSFAPVAGQSARQLYLGCASSRRTNFAPRSWSFARLTRSTVKSMTTWKSDRNSTPMTISSSTTWTGCSTHLIQTTHKRRQTDGSRVHLVGPQQS